MSHTITALHSYRAILIPTDANQDSLEELAEAGLLPTLRVKACSSDQAKVNAHKASGKGVLRVERVGEVEA